MFGVLMLGLPWAAIESGRWSSARMKSTLGWAAVAVQESPMMSNPSRAVIRWFMSYPF